MPPLWRRQVATAVIASASVGLLVLTTGPAAAGSNHPHRITGGAAHRPAPIDSLTGPTVVRRNTAPAVTRLVPNELLAQTLAEDDDDNPEAPNLSALCQSFLGSPNPYGNPAPNVDAINGDTTVTVGSQTGCQSAQNETTIAVNPFNPLNIVAGSNDYRQYNSRENRNDSSGWAYTSFDGGRTWANNGMPHLVFQSGATGALSDMDAAGDPSITFGPLNTVYYANIVFSRLNAGSGIAVSVSHNGGLTWGDPSIVQLDGVNPDGTPTDTDFFNDKEWVAADPFSGTVYVTWTRFTSDDAGNFIEAPIVMRKSTNFGRTWGSMTRVAPKLNGFSGGITPFDQGSLPQVAGDGTLYIAYEASVCATLACDGINDHDAIVVATSKNGGNSFKNVEVSLDFDFPPNEDTGTSTLTGENFRINSFPQMAIDRATGKLWITWADDRNGSYSGGESVKTNGDNFVVSSSDGKHWSTPIRAASTSADEVYPAIAAFAGRVAVSTYTRSFDPTGIGLDYVMSVGWDNAVAIAPIRRITTATQNPQVQFVAVGLVSGDTLQGTFIGDYTAVAIGTDFKLHPCWTDFRGLPGTNTPNQDVYTQSISAL